MARYAFYSVVDTPYSYIGQSGEVTLNYADEQSFTPLTIPDDKTNVLDPNTGEFVLAQKYGLTLNVVDFTDTDEPPALVSVGKFFAVPGNASITLSYSHALSQWPSVNCYVVNNVVWEAWDDGVWDGYDSNYPNFIGVWDHGNIQNVDLNNPELIAPNLPGGAAELTFVNTKPISVYTDDQALFYLKNTVARQEIVYPDTALSLINGYVTINELATVEMIPDVLEFNEIKLTWADLGVWDLYRKRADEIDFTLIKKNLVVNEYTDITVEADTEYVYGLVKIGTSKNGVIAVKTPAKPPLTQPFLFYQNVINPWGTSFINFTWNDMANYETDEITYELVRYQELSPDPGVIVYTGPDLGAQDYTAIPGETYVYTLLVTSIYGDTMDVFETIDFVQNVHVAVNESNDQYIDLVTKDYPLNAWTFSTPSQIIQGEQFVPGYYNTPSLEECLRIFDPDKLLLGSGLVNGSAHSMFVDRQISITNTNLFQIPSYGFMDAQNVDMSLEFWLHLYSALEEYDGELLMNKPIELISFGNGETKLSIMNNTFVIQWQPTTNTLYKAYGYFGDIDRPMHVVINYSSKGDGILIEVLVDTIKIIELYKRNEEILVDEFKVKMPTSINEAGEEVEDLRLISKSDYITFVAAGGRQFNIGPIVIYPYLTSTEQAIKHFVYGHGTPVPSALNTLSGGEFYKSSVTNIDTNVRKLEVPSNFPWQSGKLVNLNVEGDVLSTIKPEPPTYNDDGSFYFTKLNNKVGGTLAGIQVDYDIDALIADIVDDGNPLILGDKVTLFSLVSGESYIVFYISDTYDAGLIVPDQPQIYADFYFKDGIKNEDILSGTFASNEKTLLIDPADSSYLIGMLFDKFANLLFHGRTFFDSRTLTLHIGYVPAEINSAIIETWNEGVGGEETTGDPDKDQQENQKLYDNAFGFLDENDNQLVKFNGVGFIVANADGQYDSFNANGTYITNALRPFTYWDVNLKTYKNRGKWLKRIALTSLTKDIQSFDPSGYVEPLESLDYIQFCTFSNYPIYLTFYTTSPPAQRVVEPYERVYKLTESPVNKTFKMHACDIISFPTVGLKWEDVSVEVEFDLNGYSRSMTQTFQNDVDVFVGSFLFKGIAHDHYDATTFGFESGNRFAPFTRYNGQVQPNWNYNDRNAIVRIPTAQMPYSYLNARNSIALRKSGEDQTNISQGFLIKKYMTKTEDGQFEEMSGFSFMFKVSEGFIQDPDYDSVVIPIVKLRYADGLNTDDLATVTVYKEFTDIYTRPKLNFGINSGDIHYFLTINQQRLYDGDINPPNFYGDQWYVATVLFVNPPLNNTSGTYHLEFIGNEIDFTNFIFITTSQFANNYFIVKENLVQGSLATYVYNTLIGNNIVATTTNDVAETISIVQSVWSDVYTNLNWRYTSNITQNYM